MYAVNVIVEIAGNMVSMRHFLELDKQPSLEKVVVSISSSDSPEWEMYEASAEDFDRIYKVPGSAQVAETTDRRGAHAAMKARRTGGAFRHER
jgi:hypothetical protein